MSKTDDQQSDFQRQWAYMTPGPLGTSPVFAWPPRPGAMARWFADRWLVLGENLLRVYEANWQ